MTAGITKVVLEDGLLTAQWMEGEERGAFWGTDYTDNGCELEFHDHVAVLTVEDGVATSIEYFHSAAEARRAADIPIYYGMFSSDGNRAIDQMICCAIVAVRQGRERSLVTALLRDSIGVIKNVHGEAADTAVRDRIINALAPIFEAQYGVPITTAEVRVA